MSQVVVSASISVLRIIHASAYTIASRDTNYVHGADENKRRPRKVIKDWEGEKGVSPFFVSERTVNRGEH